MDTFIVSIDDRKNTTVGQSIMSAIEIPLRDTDEVISSSFAIIAALKSFYLQLYILYLPYDYILCFKAFNNLRKISLNYTVEILSMTSNSFCKRPWEIMRRTELTSTVADRQRV